MTHAHSLQHDAPPTVDQLAALITRGAWLELAATMKLGNLSIPLPPESWAAWGWAPLEDAPEARITMLGATSSDRVVLVEGLSSLAPLRRLAMASRRHNPTVELLWWCVLDDALVAAVVDEDDLGRPLMRTIQIDRASPRREQLDKWLALSPIEDSRTLRHRTRDVMRQETLTRAFFKGFQRCFAMLRDQLLDGPRCDEERHDVALLVMLRLVVLYFLQSRGALDGEKRYLMSRLAAHSSTSATSFWEETLRPLFFGVLNRPRHTRSTSAKMLGRMPFLNGGLFEPSAIERAYPDLTWADDVWHCVIEEFFETYRFALAEPTGSDEHDAIDPEVLGKVFEGLMYGDRRNASGSFYTPRGLVTEMVERAILGHLAAHLDVDDAILSAWLTTHEESEPVTIDVAMLREALEALTILDPAAGTGAFLMETLQLLRSLWGRLRACGEEGPNPDTYAGVRQMIHDHLHGVDRDVTAIRLCELRFWLALLGTLPRDLSAMIHKLEPLPNLGHKFSAGDSLLSALDLNGARDATGGAWSGELSRDVFGDLVDEIAALHERHLMSHGAAKQALRTQLEARERELFEKILTARSERLRERMKPLELLASSKDLFDQPNELTPSQRDALDNLQKEVDAIQALCGRAQGSPGFCFELRFARVMARGGFDVIITNPPWVRATKQDPVRKKLYAGRYTSGEGKLWRDASACGVRATFGSQVDLATLFIERSLELLATDGRLCALVPSKLLRALHGAGLRGVMAEHHLIGIEDLSGSDQHLFDATTYPMILELQKRDRERRGARARRAPRRSRSSRRAPALARFGLWSAHRKTTWRAPMESLLSIGADAREPWMLAPPELEATFEVMRRSPKKLGEHEALRPRRGVLTGCNAAFVKKADAMLEAFGHDRALMFAHTRPVFQGRHISAWALHTDERILWPYDESLRLHGTLPAPAFRLLAPHRARLEQRSDMKRGQPWWRLYRVQDGVDGPKVVWRDLAPWMEATPCLDGEIPLNTAYYIPCPDSIRAWGLCALLNSTPARCFLWALGERARGGWRRHFAWIVASLPIPERWSRWLSGAPDLELEALVQSFRAHPDGAAQANALIARDYGIDRRALEDLQQLMAFHVKHAPAHKVSSKDEVAA